MGQPRLIDTPVAPARTLPVIGEQKDIRYHAANARSVLNRPQSTGMPYWSLNPYVGCAFGCTYCYARYAHKYAVQRAPGSLNGPDDDAMPGWLAFERRILVKTGAAALMRRALRPGSAIHRALTGGDTVVIGTATDPYQPAERRFRVTRGVLEVLAEHGGLSVVVITKSPLVTRDAELLASISRRSVVTVHMSLITLDRELARRIEPRAPTPEARLRAVRRLALAGVDVGINCMPVLPGITDDTGALDALVAAVAAAGATHIGAGALRLRASSRERYFPFLAREFPALAARYRSAYAASHELGDGYRSGLREFFHRSCERHGISFGMRDRSEDELLRITAAAREARTDGDQLSLL